MKNAVMETVSARFRPEFLNRIDNITVFHPLERDQLVEIAKIQIEHLQQRLKSRDMELKLSYEVLAKLSKAGFDPVYGARSLKRVIQNQLENLLAQEILAGRYGAGEVIRAAVKGDESCLNNASSLLVSAG